MLESDRQRLLAIESMPFPYVIKLGKEFKGLSLKQHMLPEAI